jgi:AcrR family transcriptional regulator
MNTKRDHIIQTALKLTEKRGWNALSLMDVAHACEISLADMLEWFSDKTDLLIGYGRSLDLQTVSDLDKADDSMALKDRLFDVLMTRIDLLNDNRGATLSILNDIKCNPVSAFIVLPHLSHSMQLMLDAAGGAVHGVKGHLHVYGLTLCYLNTLRVWCGDDSVDLSKTMAALDKNLGYFENIKN